MSNDTSLAALERFSTGIPGLDTVLDGGLFSGGVYLVEGAPGAGKTILANQVCFHHVARGDRRALYITLLAESHSRLLQHLQSLAFFDGSVIPDRLTYVSGFRVLEADGLKGLIDLIRKELRAQRPSLVVLDGFAAVGESTDSDREFKKLVHELQVNAGLARCTFFLLSSSVSAVVHPVHTMVDGLVRLSEKAAGRRAERELKVQKLRGSGYLRGLHAFTISDAGIHVYPRIESHQQESLDPCTDQRLSFNLPSLDAIMGGGLPCDTTTMLLGPSGVGKTTLGYKFLEGSTDEQPGLAFSFYETKQRAVLKARGLNIELGGPIARGDLDFIWHRPVEISLDAVAEQLLAAVDHRGVKRLFIDGFNAFLVASGSPDRVPQFFAALAEELRRRNVTTLYSAELHEVFSTRIAPPCEGVSPLLENLVLLRFVEMGARVHRLISVLKMRASAFDPALRGFTITPQGLSVDDTFAGAEALLTGEARKPERRTTPRAQPKAKRPTMRKAKRKTSRKG